MYHEFILGESIQSMLEKKKTVVYKMKPNENKSMQQMDIEADNLAIKLLMPKKLIEQNFSFQMQEDRIISLMEVQQIANYFHVSLPIAYARLVQLRKKLEYLPRAFYA